MKGCLKTSSIKNANTVNFKADLKINVQTEIKHYTWQEECCKREEGQCVKY